MANKQSEPTTKEESHPVASQSHGHYQPVVLTDTVGAVFLGIISIILLAIVGGLLIHIRKLKNQLRESDHSLE